MFSFFAPFIIGFLGSFHCLGMCGPLVIAYSLHLKNPLNQGEEGNRTAWKTGLFHHLSFQIGRLLTYGALGFTASGLVYLIDVKSLFTHLRGGVTLLVGILMCLTGLFLLNVIPTPGFLSDPLGSSGSPFKRWMASLFRSQNPASKIVLGVLTGFLPCMLSWSMVLKAMTEENPFRGWLTMTLFGLGTVPALFLAGFSASFVTLRMRIAGERLAALSVILMGLILIFKGVRFFIRFYG